MFNRQSVQFFSTIILSAVSIIAISFGSSVSEAKLGTRVSEKKVRIATLMESASGNGLAKYQSAGGKYKFVFAAEGFNEGDNIDIFVGNIKVGSMTMALDPVDAIVVAELVFLGSTGDTSEWAPGIPLDLTVGTMVRMVNTTSGEMMEGSLEIL